MRIPGDAIISAAAIGVAFLGSIGLRSELPPEDPAPAPAETVTEYVEVPVPNVPTHPCHEDEAAIVRPYGLVCVPVDDLVPDHDRANLIIDTEGRSAYWPSEYVIAPRNAPDTEPTD